MKMRRVYIYIVAVAACVAIGVALGYALFGQTPQGSSSVTRQGGYNFINPLLSCDINEDVPDSKFDSLRQSLTQLINQDKDNGYATRISIYFRDMNTGNWTGVGENDVYIPASLLKVPVMIAYLHQQETTGGVLNTYYSLPSSPDTNASEYFKPEHPLTLGGAYTVTDLIKAMITQSDNNAAAVLQAHMSPTSIADVYNNFGLPIEPSEADADMSPVEYMRVFRILYNATYLDRSDSEQALELLSAIDFPQGAVKGLPSGMPFANKFGERTVETVSSGQTVVQKRDLADCGIVYYPGNPYGICIMTEGRDFSQLANVIADISGTVYESVNNGLLKNQ